jgi:RNA polymerase sigma-70 factor, ECF subfamily
MRPEHPAAPSPAPEVRAADQESAAWLAALTSAGPPREQALVRLYEMLLRIARGEATRRAGQLRIAAPELDDLAHQAAADAMMAIIGKLAQFRGDSRFTTWAYKFVIFEISAKVSRHYWRYPDVSMDAGDWDRLPARLGAGPADEAQGRDLLAALRTAVTERLTERQRRVFVAIVLNGVPLDALVAELGTSRGAIYKVLFDARRSLKAELAANGYLDHGTVRQT